MLFDISEAGLCFVMGKIKSLIYVIGFVVLVVVFVSGCRGPITSNSAEVEKWKIVLVQDGESRYTARIEAVSGEIDHVTSGQGSEDGSVLIRLATKINPNEIVIESQKIDTINGIWEFRVDSQEKIVIENRTGRSGSIIANNNKGLNFGELLDINEGALIIYIR